MIYNVYCDESCHLEHDGINPMLLGCVWCPESEKKDFRDRIIVRVMFTVDIDGSISDFEITEVVNSATREMQEEALRLARMLPKYTPAMVSNVENEPLHKVRAKDNIIISF